MKIYSWNMLFKNPDPDRALDFIKNSEFDVFCLQEVPPEFIERLRALQCNMAFALDTDRLERSRAIEMYCVILSPHEISGSRAIEFPVEERPLRARLTQYGMSGMQRIDRRGSLYADIDLPAGRTRVFSLHLSLSYPARILREFDLAMRERDTSALNIVCGDFNTLESLRITILNWLLGGRMRDAFARRKTRRDFQERFARLNLKNPLRGARTQKIAHSQLDHILVPASFEIKEAAVLKDRRGSDHNPIFVETAG